MEFDAASCENVKAAILVRWDILFYIGSKPGEVTCYSGNTAHETLQGSVAPRLIGSWKYSQVAAAGKLFVVHSKQRVSLAEKIWMVDDLYAIRLSVKHTQISYLVENVVMSIVYEIVCYNRRECVLLPGMRCSTQANPPLFLHERFQCWPVAERRFMEETISDPLLDFLTDSSEFIRHREVRKHCGVDGMIRTFGDDERHNCFF